MINNIVKIVCDHFQVPVELVYTKTRKHEVVQARHVSVYFIREIKKTSFLNLAKVFNNDHSTCINSVKTIKNWIETDKSFAVEIDNLRRKVKIVKAWIPKTSGRYFIGGFRKMKMFKFHKVAA
jgi:chromosomal replication initiator protein